MRLKNERTCVLKQSGCVTVTASKPREDVYNLIDQVLESGKPVVIERKGHRLLLILEKKEPKLFRLVKRCILPGDAESIVHRDWLKDWNRDQP